MTRSSLAEIYTMAMKDRAFLDDLQRDPLIACQSRELELSDNDMETLKYMVTPSSSRKDTFTIHLTVDPNPWPPVWHITYE